jgi:parallel beta-helix repeat protein
MKNDLYGDGLVLAIIVLFIGLSVVPQTGSVENDISNGISFFSNYQDTNPPDITINFAGNPFDNGGPYWAYITTPNGQLEEGVQASNGYYTNDSSQQENWMYIGVTVADESTIDHVWLNWLNGTTWTNLTYEFVHTTGDCYEINTRESGIMAEEGFKYSFDVVACDSAGNSKTVRWGKIGIGGSLDQKTRRYVQLNCSPTDNIYYVPYYFYDAYYAFPDDSCMNDRMHHDQGADGSPTDTGYLNSSVPSDVVSFRYCSNFVGYWFDDTVCIKDFTLDSIYYHFWWTSNTGSISKMGWYKLRSFVNGHLSNYYSSSDVNKRSSIYYDNGENKVSNMYYLDAHLLDVTDTVFTDNDIYELGVSVVCGNQNFPSLISNRSFVSFVLFNVPDDETLNETYYDSDNDGLSDWTELYVTYTSPFFSDTDNDGATDYDEIHAAISSYGQYQESDPNDYTDTTDYRYINIGGPYYGVENETILFDGSVEGGTLPFSWHWDFGDGTNSTKENSTHNYGVADTYTVTLTVTNNVNISVSVTTAVTIAKELDANAHCPYCEKVGESVGFKGSATGGFPEYCWHWDFGDGTNSTEQNPNHVYNSPGIYTVLLTVSDSRGYSSLDIATVTIESSEADAHGPYACFVNELVRFNGSISGGIPPYNWSWDFGDGNISDQQNPKHVYEKAGEYQVILTVTDNMSYVANDSTIVKIGKIILVDDDFNASVSGWGIDHFNKIQHAINAASDYETVLVSDGTYDENVVINKIVKIKGKNRNSTIISPITGDIGVKLTVPCIIFSSFTVRDCTTGIKIEADCSHCYISDCYLTSMSGSTGNALYSHGNYISVSNCTFEDNGCGIYLKDSSNNTISGNTIAGNNRYGIFLEVSSDNIITFNNFLQNKRNAFFIDCNNVLDGNYWNRPRLLPYPIFGTISFDEYEIPWISIDWHPRLLPYKIRVLLEVGPYTQNVDDNNVTIVWETSIPTINNRVEYGENSSYGYVEYGSSGRLHHEIMINPPFTSGHYKVISDGIESGDFEFKLASHCYDTQEFKCVIFGDSRGTWDNWENAAIVANAVNEESPDFVIHGGDMVTDGTKLSEWDSWLTLMKPLMQNSMVFGVMGNHERKCSRYYEIFALPNNEKWYCFDYGPCHFIVLDNYELWNVGSSQYEWLEEDLQTTDKPFKIICFHEPIYCSGGHSPRTDVRAVWGPLFNKYNVDLVFQSHCHYYQRTNDINGTTYIVSGGAGAPLYTPKDAWFVNNSQKAYHYCVLDVSLTTMEITFSARYVNGTTFDEFIVCPPFVS